MTRSKLEAMHYRISSSVVLSPNGLRLYDGWDKTSRKLSKLPKSYKHRQLNKFINSALVSYTSCYHFGFLNTNKMKIVLDKLDKEEFETVAEYLEGKLSDLGKKKKETEDNPKQLEQMINTIRRALAFSQAE